MKPRCLYDTVPKHSHTTPTSDALFFYVWKEDSDKYYTWRSYGPEDQRTQELWVDMNDVRHGQVRVHGILSNSYKQAVVSPTHKNTFINLLLTIIIIDNYWQFTRYPKKNVELK